MKKNVRLLLCLLIISYYSIAQQQEPFLQWQKTYGGTRGDVATSIQQTTDGGYITAGASQSTDGDVTSNHGDFDYWIVKSDARGKMQWETSLGGSASDAAQSIQQTTDGGYIVAGNSQSTDGNVTGNHGVDDYWIVKLNANGNIQWQKSLGGSYEEFVNSIKQTADGGYIVAGGATSHDGDVSGNHGAYDYWIVKLDASGNIQWQKSLGGSMDEAAYSIQQTTDKGYIIAGESSSDDGDVSGHHSDGPDYWVVKIDSLGNIQWQKSLGGSNNDFANSIQQTADGGYIVAGESSSSDGDVTGHHGNGYADYWVVKLDNLGAIQWQKSLGGTSEDVAKSIQQAKDGGYIIAGYTRSNNGNVLSGRHGGFDYWIVKLDALGHIEWQKVMGGSSYYDEANAIVQTADEGYIVAGYAQSNDYNVTGNHGYLDSWIVKLSPETLNDNIHINVNHISSNCEPTNSVSCIIKDTATAYTVRLYWFGVLYDSALNVIGNISFHNLKFGAYYVTATDENGNVSCSKEADIIPSPYSLNTANVTATTAILQWIGFDCTDGYKIQFHVQGTTEWENVTTGYTNNYTLNNLLSATTYVWRVASEERGNGIKAIGKFSYSATFTTASSIAGNTNQVNNISVSALHSNQLSVSPNPAKNSFKIFFNTTSSNKINALLYDVNGKAVWSSGLMYASSINNKTVNTTAFARGVYYLKLMDEDGKLISATKVVIVS